jgi:hypothetical protein
MSEVIELQLIRRIRERERLEQDIECLLDRYAEQHEAARALVAQDWGLTWFFFRSLALEWVGRGGSAEELKTMICDEIDAAGVGG